VLNDGRAFPAAAIPASDAIALVMNRMVELLDLEGGAESREARAYHAVKIMLDLAGSALAFTGRYVSPYAGRPEPFAALTRSLPDLEKSLKNADMFIERLRWAARCKHSPTEALLLDAERDDVLGAIAGWAQALWMWEVRRVLGQPSATLPQLVEGYLAREPLARRLKGWAKFCLHPLRPRGALRPFRSARLFFEGSPQSLTYASALLLYGARFGDDTGRSVARAASLLPVPVMNELAGISPDDVCALWRWLIRNG
jgi:hypothetical protein